MLALHELHNVLVGFELYDSRIEDVISLLRYSYENTVRGRLRELVAVYVACNVERFSKSNNFQDLLDEYGDFGRILLCRCCQDSKRLTIDEESSEA